MSAPFTMSAPESPPPQSAAGSVVSPTAASGPETVFPERAFSCLPPTLLLFAGCLLTGAIAFLDDLAGPQVSLGLFYLLPVGACAWWGGSPHGILMALAATFAWYAVDLLEQHTSVPAIDVWNGIVRFSTLVVVSSLMARVKAGVLRERRLARTDPLTGAANNRAFYAATSAEADRSYRTGRPLTLAYLDLDNFKHLNDRFGHAAGDAALLNVVRAIRLNLRASDILARLGGDEFALLLPESDVTGVVQVLERLREEVGREMTNRGWPVTLSIGALTFLRPMWDVDLMIQQVDALMYQAKKKGKARVEHAVVGDPADSGPTGERRSSQRLLCKRSARVWQEGNGDAEKMATIHDVSIQGISLCLPERIAHDSLLVVEPLSAGVLALFAKVEHSAWEDGSWRHGCRLLTPLSEAGFRRLLVEHGD